MNTDQEVLGKLRQYKISQIACLLWVNLFPYLFGLACYLVAPGYVIFKRLNYLGHIFILLGLLQIIVMVVLICRLISQQSLFTPRNLLQWFFASIFVIFLSIIIVVPPSLIIFTNPSAPEGPDELDKARFGPFVTKDMPSYTAVVAQENERIGRVRNVRILCLMLLLANMLLCGIWFIRTNRLIQTLNKHS